MKMTYLCYFSKMYFDFVDFYFVPIFFLFQKINWDDLAAKKVPAPFKPVIRDELDVSNFAEEFTEMDPTYSPAALPQSSERLFQVTAKGTRVGWPQVLSKKG